MDDIEDNAATDAEPRVRAVESCHIAELIRIGEETRLSPWTAQNYFDELKNPHAVMLRLVDDENRTIGFVVGRITLAGDVDISTEGEIYNIAVIESEQNRGRGQILFDAFSEICRERKVCNVWLEVRESNATAIRFYERNGFVAVQTRPHFYDHPREHAILMKLDLKISGA